LKQLATRIEGRLTYLRRQLVKSVTYSSYTYVPSARAKRLMAEIQKLEAGLERKRKCGWFKPLADTGAER